MNLRYPIAVLFALLTLPFVLQAEEYASPPAVVMEVSIPAESNCLVSIPFDVFDLDLRTVLSNQLTAGYTADESDGLLLWDSDAQTYQTLRLLPIRGQEFGGDWVWEAPIREELETSLVSLHKSRAFWIQNRQTRSQKVVLSGRVPIDDSADVVLPDALSLFGYPYVGSVPFNETFLPLDAEVKALDHDLFIVDQDEALFGLYAERRKDPQFLGPEGRVDGRFKTGQGLWFHNLSRSAINWSELRPYENAFEEGLLPEIVEVLYRPSEQAIGLRIACAGAGRKVDVYYKDEGVDETFSSLKGWKPAAIELVSEGPELIWWDVDYSHRGRSAKPLRYYLVVDSSSDQDSDGDGVIDGRERYLLGSDPSLADSQTRIEALTLLSRAGFSQSEAKAAGVDRLSLRLADLKAAGRRIIYVCEKTGSDKFDGVRSTVASLENSRGAERQSLDPVGGPKKTINAGMSTVQRGDVLVIREGYYNEDLLAAGRDVNIIFDGNVRISRTPEPRPKRANAGIIEINTTESIEEIRP